MNQVNYFSDIGLNINITPDDNLKIQGLSSLQSDLKNQVLQYAKKNKWQILFEIKTQNKTIQEKIDILWNQADKLADWIDDSSSTVPWQERAARVPELQEMSLEIDNLITQQDDGNGK